MSWPTDGLPRFKVAFMSWVMWREPQMDGYVYDRAYCHEIVGHFRSVDLPNLMGREARSEAIRNRTVGFAATLEAEHARL